MPSRYRFPAARSTHVIASPVRALTPASRILLSRLLLLLAAVFTAFPACAQSSSRDTEQVRAVMKATWEKPGAPLTVEPVVVARSHAIAGWAQGTQGGRALLERRGGKWVVYVCGGDQLLGAAELVRAGVPSAAARDLAAQLAVAEGRMDPELRAKLSLFKEVIRVDAGHGPGTTHGAGGHAAGNAGHGKH